MDNNQEEVEIQSGTMGSFDENPGVPTESSGISQTDIPATPIVPVSVQSGETVGFASDPGVPTGQSGLVPTSSPTTTTMLTIAAVPIPTTPTAPIPISVVPPISVTPITPIPTQTAQGFGNVPPVQSGALIGFIAHPGVPTSQAGTVTGFGLVPTLQAGANI